MRLHCAALSNPAKPGTATHSPVGPREVYYLTPRMIVPL